MKLRNNDKGFIDINLSDNVRKLLIVGKKDSGKTYNYVRPTIDSELQKGNTVIYSSSKDNLSGSGIKARGAVIIDGESDSFKDDLKEVKDIIESGRQSLIIIIDNHKDVLKSVMDSINEYGAIRKISIFLDDAAATDVREFIVEIDKLDLLGVRFVIILRGIENEVELDIIHDIEIDRMMAVVTDSEKELIDDGLNEAITAQYTNNPHFKSVYIVDGSNGRFIKIIDLNN